MKKMILVLIISIGFIKVNLQVKAKDDEVFIVDTEKVLVKEEKDNIKKLSNGFLVFDNLEIQVIYQNQEIFKISEEYLTHNEDSESIYLISKSNIGLILRKINKTTKKTNSKYLSFDSIGDSILTNKEITIVGSKNKDAIIEKYNLSLEYLQTHTFGGDGYEEFTKIYYHQNRYYLLGRKDAHSSNSPFLNVGNKNEQKVFMTIIDERGIILDTCYFNHYEQDEWLGSTDYHEGIFLVEVLTNNCRYIYQLDDVLKCLDYYELNNTATTRSVLSSTGKCLIVEENSSLVLNTSEQTRELQISGKLEEIVMEDNVLKIYYYRDYYLWEAKVYQYRVEKQEDIIINIFDGSFDPNGDMNNLSQIKVTSDIHKLNITLLNTKPILNKQVSGTYQGIFKIYINPNKSFELLNPIIVEEYINVFDQHIYPVGYKLHFFGNALLDDKTIVYGTKLTSEGWHSLVITDAAGNIKKMDIKVVDDYYNKEEEYPNTDYTTSKNQPINISITTNKEVLEVVINGESVPFEAKEDEVVINMNASDEPGVYKYYLEKIVFEDEVLLPKQMFTVKVLKDAPSIEIIEDESDNLVFNIGVLDLDKSLKDLIFEVVNSDENSKTYSSSLKDYTLNIGNISVDKDVKIKVFLLHDIGDGLLVKTEVMSFSFQTLVSEYTFVQMDISEDYQKITLDINTHNSSLELKEILVQGKDISSRYQVTNNYTPIYVSISLSVIIILMATAYLFLKKYLKK